MSNNSYAIGRVEAALNAAGMNFQVAEFSESTRTSEEAAAAIGCDVAQIAKSLIFQRKRDGAAVLVIASGANRVNEKKLAKLLGEKVRRPDADFVRQETGFVIGGVPPVGHPAQLETWIDESLSKLEPLWAAAGTPNAVFKLNFDALVALTRGTVADLKA